VSEQKFTKGQTWGALKKAWKAYKIAKVQNDRTRMMEYAKRIQTLQKELGLQVAKFPDLGL
jgi:division protein CdvB (Snf7/Vps24/ESCRT-III family)